ncbi:MULTISPECIES: hypothetical protein [unclassified Mesorhizobium]|uniref:hypothetical protein n=1 Tax=unclassified Mesorhizobium TaxID=325217 RepID=UPI00112D370D|nr:MULTISPECIES: hypothetical protein [unclassified Mesorhizobium]TPK76520.1 hypothetical protein FJ548_26400 [Mesorhizobium sp. B2-4-17]UCI33278.1 hypothetical protein FJW03_07580 [Mesorhizobium sp. B4-1-4]
MMSLFLAIHIHAAKRGDGLLPEFLGARPQPRDLPKAMNENPTSSAPVVKGASKPDPHLRKAVRKPVIL